MYKIGYDAKRAFRNYTGLGNYSRTIISSLSRFYSQNQYLLFTPPYANNPLHSFADYPNISVHKPSGINALFHQRWRSITVANELKRLGVDLYHGLSGELPEGRCDIPMVVTIHDAIFMRMPHLYGRVDRYLYEKKQIHACRRADKIIAVSRQTADDAIKYFGADPSKIEVVYQSCDRQFQGAVSEELKREAAKKYNLPERFVLSVGRVEERKNLHNTVKAMSLVPKDIKLVSIGGSTSYSKRVEAEIRSAGLSDRVVFLHPVPFGEFPAIYAQAEMLIYPSLFEGFGIPVLEAISCGTPVITSAVSSMPEVGGDSVLYVEPQNYRDIAEKINLLLSSPTLREELIGKGAEQSRLFIQERVTSQINDIYNSLLK